MSLFKRIRERRLFQIVAAYLAGGWVAIQVVDQVTDQGVLPGFLYELALLWFLVGIPAAVVVGWYHGEKGRQTATRPEVAALLAIVALGGLLSVGTLSDEFARRVRLEAARASLDLRRVAVLYFDDLTPGAGARHIADGFTEAMIDRLAPVRELDVVSRNGVAPFRGAGLRRDSVGRLLEAGTLVDGSIEETGDRLRVGIRLIDGQSGAEFRRAGFELPATELVRAREEAVEQATRLLRQWLGEEVRLRRTRGETESVSAWALYQRGEKARKDAAEALHRHDAEAADAALDRADTLLAHAEVMDPSWPEPATLRGYIASRRARSAGIAGHPRESVEWIRKGVAHVERALRLDPNHARALELRGTLHYYHHLLEMEHDPEAQAALLRQARDDLERAVDLDPTLAPAHALLSHVYLRVHDLTAALMAGRNAYQEDAYLDNADVIVARNIDTSYALEQFTEARRWCETGQRRFPEDHRFVECELKLLAAPRSEPDIERAWALRARVDSLAPAHGGEWARIRAELFVGGVLARAGLADSARSVLLRARGRVTPHVDVERFLYALEAHMRTLLGDHDEALELLKRYAAVNPGVDLNDNWWWRPLRGHPRWREVAIGRAHDGGLTAR
ncbi:MAG: hypothetical protein KY466_06080 [Gemmatimonadetes bacterium]|nr:hypothetical protein [Gemmatimonadota bacterium]